MLDSPAMLGYRKWIIDTMGSSTAVSSQGVREQRMIGDIMIKNSGGKGGREPLFNPALVWLCVNSVRFHEARLAMPVYRKYVVCMTDRVRASINYVESFTS